MKKQRILFICTGNSARSQMAEGLVNALLKDKYEAFSAGTHPSSVNPFAIQAMKEVGIDISHHTSKSIADMQKKELDLVVTVCDNAKETCPVFPSMTKQIHQGFEDPAAVQGTDAEKLEAFRKIRDEIRRWIQEL